MSHVEIIFGNENFGNYKRLSYKWWYAFAEFIDNSSQSYFDNRDVLDKAFENEQDSFRVAITTGKDLCRITDNAMGMNLEDLQKAMIIGVPREGTKGRCKYGLGMKTAACWIGDSWKIITTKLGSNKKYTLEINVNDIVKGNTEPPVTSSSAEESEHYTILEISDHHRPLKGGRTINKIKAYLPSIYRQDLSQGSMILTYNDSPLEWAAYSDGDFLKAKDGKIYKNSFIFQLDKKNASSKVVEGWVGILEKGSRSKAGFSILQHERVIMGWPDSWRPAEIFGEGGRNDLVNQRLVGEINLADFEVSHAKDEINWYGEEEEQVGAHLKSECQGFIDIARKPRKGSPPGHGPNAVDVDVACKTMEEELATPELLSRLALEPTLPPVKQIAENNHQVIQNAESHAPAFPPVNVGDTEVKVFLDSNGSPYDPYFLHESKGENSLAIIISIQHPHWSMLEGDNAVLNYLRHCVYDGLAEFRAAKMSRLEFDSVKMLKDGYLRAAFEVLQSDDD